MGGGPFAAAAMQNMQSDPTQGLEDVAARAPGQLGQSLQDNQQQQQQPQPQQQQAPTDPEEQHIQQVRQQLMDTAQRYAAPPTQGGTVKRMLTNFVSSMSHGMIPPSQNPDFLRQQALTNLNQLDQTQATIDYHKQLVQQMQQQKMLTISTPEMAESMGLPATMVGSQLPATSAQGLMAAKAKRDTTGQEVQGRLEVAQINQGMMMPIDENTRQAIGLPEGTTQLPLNQLNKAISARVRPDTTVQGATDQYQYNRLTGQKTPMGVGNPRVAMIQERARLTPFETVEPGTNIPKTISNLEAVQTGAPKVPITAQQKMGGQYALYNDAYGILDNIAGLTDKVNLDDPAVRARVTAGYAALKDPASKGLTGEFLSNFLARQPVNSSLTPDERQLALTMAQGKSAAMGLRGILGQAGVNEMQQRLDAALFPGGNSLGSKANVKQQLASTRQLLDRFAIGQPQAGMNAPNQPNALANRSGSDFGPANGKPEGATGTMSDGTKVIVHGGRIVKK